MALAQTTYKEVLDATKHQDDKIGRFLAAVAFFTAAAVAFGTRSDVLGVRYDIDGLVPLPGILFAMFFSLVVLTVIFLLMGLGQTLSPPQLRQGTFSSRLFFMSIADFGRERWEQHWDRESEAIERDLLNDYIRESHNLATRADRKYRRTSEAQVFFTLALACFALALALAINQLPQSSSRDTSWSVHARLITAAVVGSFTLALGYGWVRHAETRAQTVRDRLKSFAPFVPWAATFYVLAMLVPPRGVSLDIGAGVAAACFIVVGRCVFDRRDRLTMPGVVAGAWWLVVLFASVAAVTLEMNRVRLALAMQIILWLELPRLFSASRVWSERQHLATAQPGS